MLFLNNVIGVKCTYYFLIRAPQDAEYKLIDYF